MEIIIYILITAIISFFVGIFFIDAQFSRFKDLEKYLDENLSNKEAVYRTNLAEYKTYINELETELKERENKIDGLQKENDLLSGIFIAFKEKHGFESKKAETANSKTDVENKALTNFV
ncbi:MAG: hypothetical protein Q7U04_13745 [Bacteriovorax sp.]|nr:hypothetical protein [Bacteriovorax sp.]